MQSEVSELSLQFILTTIHLQINRNFMYCIFSFSFYSYSHIHTIYCTKCVKIHNIDVALLDLQGPIFVHEPPHKIEFSNNTGGHIHCSGHANPYPEVIFFKCQFLFLYANDSTQMT